MEKQATNLLSKWHVYESTIIQDEVDDLRILLFLLFFILLALWLIIDFAKEKIKVEKDPSNSTKKRTFLSNIKYLVPRVVIALIVSFCVYRYVSQESYRSLKEEFFNNNESVMLQYLPTESMELKSLSSSDRLFYLARYAAANGGERKIIRYAVEKDKGIQFEEIVEEGNTIYYQPIKEGEKPKLVVYEKKFISDELESIFYEDITTSFLGFKGEKGDLNYGDIYYVFRCPSETLDLIDQKFEVN